MALGMERNFVGENVIGKLIEKRNVEVLHEAKLNLENAGLACIRQSRGSKIITRGKQHPLVTDLMREMMHAVDWIQSV